LTFFCDARIHEHKKKYAEYFNDMFATSIKTKTDNLVRPDTSTCIKLIIL
jgi:hypothetical protein